MRYPYLLFDADNTLFDFDRSNRVAFNAVCAAFSLPDDDETFALYERCNNAMWAAFDRGACTKRPGCLQRAAPPYIGAAVVPAAPRGGGLPGTEPQP